MVLDYGGGGPVQNILLVTGFDTSPKHKRGTKLVAALTLRASVECVNFGRVQYCVSDFRLRLSAHARLSEHLSTLVPSPDTPVEILASVQLGL